MAAQAKPEDNCAWLVVGEYARASGRSSRSKAPTGPARIDAANLTAHSVIVAQSGSGKSYFLCRLLEEMALNTEARIVVLDPNSDLRKFHVPRTSFEKWENWSAEVVESFGEEWADQDIAIFVAGHRAILEPPYTQLQLAWPLVSMDLLAHDFDASVSSQIYACHDLVRAFAELQFISSGQSIDIKDVLEEAEDRLSLFKENETRFDDEINKLFGRPEAIDKMASNAALRRVERMAAPFGAGAGDPRVREALAENWKKEAEAEIRGLVGSIYRAAKSITEPAAAYYFSKAHSLVMQELLGEYSPSRDRGHREETGPRISVYDLPSFRGKGAQLLAVSSILTLEWERARRQFLAALLSDSGETNEGAEASAPTPPDPSEGGGEDAEAVAESAAEGSDGAHSPNGGRHAARVPTFIVIEEAHNLLAREPQTPPERAIAHQIRQIAAEGRKYGLFLVLVSQRPEKLDELVLSECANKGVMRLDSPESAESAAATLGLGESMVSQCGSDQFEIGNVCLFGKWAEHDGAKISVGLRRTEESAPRIEPWDWLPAVQPPE